MRARATILLFLAVAAARAGDAPAGSGDAPSGNGDSIAAAKKDFADIKQTAAPSDSSAVLPTLDMKDLGPTPGAARQPAPTPLGTDRESLLDPSGKKAKEGTGNWLVDAMDKKSDKSQSSQGKDDATRGDRDATRDIDRLDLQDDRDTTASADARDKASSKELAESVYNPLDSFMGGWISARDHDLLLGGTKADAAGEHASARADTLPGMDLGSAEGVADAVLPSPEAGWGGLKVDANPYLAAIDIEPEPVAKTFTLPEIPGFSTGLIGAPQGMTTSGLDPAQIDLSRSFIPDFAQPSDDDKYFKQLKRF